MPRRAGRAGSPRHSQGPTGGRCPGHGPRLRGGEDGAHTRSTPRKSSDIIVDERVEEDEEDEEDEEKIESFKAKERDAGARRNEAEEEGGGEEGEGEREMARSSAEGEEEKLSLIHI